MLLINNHNRFNVVLDFLQMTTSWERSLGVNDDTLTTFCYVAHDEANPVSWFLLIIWWPRPADLQQILNCLFHDFIHLYIWTILWWLGPYGHVSVEPSADVLSPDCWGANPVWRGWVNVVETEKWGKEKTSSLRFTVSLDDSSSAHRTGRLNSSDLNRYHDDREGIGDAGVWLGQGWLGLLLRWFSLWGKCRVAQRIEHTLMPLHMCSVNVYFCIMKGKQNTPSFIFSFHRQLTLLVDNICRCCKRGDKVLETWWMWMSSCRAHHCTNPTVFALTTLNLQSVINAWTWHPLRPVLLVLVKQIGGWTNTANTFLIIIVPVWVSTKTDVVDMVDSPTDEQYKRCKVT